MKNEEVLLQPLITEKTALASENNNFYGFKVALKANKNQIKQAIEALYDVKVLSVKTSVLPGKMKRVGRSLTKTNKTKKAFVKLGEGQSIEFFKGI